jgi:threonine 3-dehydrogenase
MRQDPGVWSCPTHRNGAFAERMAVPASTCFRLPDEVPTSTGALLEPAGVAVHAIQRSGLALGGRSVLVNGCGPVGLVLTRLSRLMGSTEVVVVEPNPYRRGLAEAAGATVLSPEAPIADTCRNLAGARGGFDVAFEVSAA